jgi:FlgD Ig-like domain
MSTRRSILVLSLVALTFSASAAVARWSNDPNVNNRLSTSTFNMANLATVPDGSGGAFSVWSEYHGGNDVYAQHLTAQGQVASGWPAGGLAICTAAGDQYVIAATADGVGGFIVAFDDYRGGAEVKTFAQRVSGAGALLWGTNGVSACAVAGEHYSAQVCADGAQGAIILWQDTRTSATTGFDIYAQRLSANGAQLWLASGLPICNNVGDQLNFKVISDGWLGGSIMCWRDSRAGNNDIYGLRLDENGSLRPGWTANGLGVCTNASFQTTPLVVSDGAYGAIFAWEDDRNGAGNGDMYALKLTPSGTIATGVWVANGNQYTTDPLFQGFPSIGSDGAGGAILAWSDARAGGAYDLYAQRITSSGTASWTAGGLAVSTAFANQDRAMVVSDGAGGAVIGWLDNRSAGFNTLFAERLTSTGAVASGWVAGGLPVGTATLVQFPTMCSDASGGAIFGFQYSSNPQLMYQQRVDQFGTLGVQPNITTVRDVPSDQGGLVKVSWDASPLDGYPAYSIARYLVFRSVPPNAAQGLRMTKATQTWSDLAAERGTLLVTGTAASAVYWEYLSTSTAYHLPGYSYLAATAKDSVAGSNAYTKFMLMAQNADGSRFWVSDADSGYSVDDLGPAAPAPFTGAYASGATNLHWGANAETDLAVYRLYRGSGPGFVPGPGNLVVAQPDTGYVDSGPAGSWYKLTAVDIHGNESAATLLSPSGTVDVLTGAAPRMTWLDRARPNPMREATTIRYALPRAGGVQLTIHDSQGRLVRTLVTGEHAAGWNEAHWDGTDASGRRVAGGLYFYRLESEGTRLNGRVLAIR